MADDDWASKARGNKIATLALVMAAATLIWQVFLWNMQRDMQKATQALQEQSVELQRQQVSNNGVVLKFTDVWVRLTPKTEGTKVANWGKEIGPQTLLGEIPLEQWTALPNRWLMAKVGNTGSRDASISQIGMKTSGNYYGWPKLAVAQCQENEASDWSADLCKQPLSAGKTRIIAVMLSDDLLQQLDNETRLSGVRICARADPYGVQCGTDPKVMLPPEIVSNPGK